MMQASAQSMGGNWFGWQPRIDGNPRGFVCVRITHDAAPSETGPRLLVAAERQGSSAMSTGSEGSVGIRRSGSNNIDGAYASFAERHGVAGRIGCCGDGADVDPASRLTPTHHSIFPMAEMTGAEFEELFRDLPWVYTGKKT